jgi:hypothetical protein
VTYVERASGQPEAAEKAYFTARALYNLSGGDECSDNMRARVAKAWFDRSYELTKLEQYFVISDEAAAAYNQFAPGKVTWYEKQVIGTELKQVNDEKLNDARHGEFTEATALNVSLKVSLDDAETRKVAEKVEKLTPARLDADGRKFEASRDKSQIVPDVGPAIERPEFVKAMELKPTEAASAPVATPSGPQF